MGITRFDHYTVRSADHEASWRFYERVLGLSVRKREGFPVPAFIVSAGDTDRTKPAPDPYLRAAELHGVPPAQCVAIEDSHWGLQSAHDAGMRTIAISHTYPRDTLEADRVVDSLDELTVDLVRGLPAR